MLPSRAVLTAALLLLAAAIPAQAQASDSVLAPAPDSSGVTAYDGHVVLSKRDPQTGRWALVRWHAGVVDVLPVAQRSVPFDADAGSDRSGNPVVVYSRCAQDPTPQTGGLAPAPDWQTARGCDLYELSLTGAPVERKLAAASSKSKSETTPSMWRGSLAFARHADGGFVPSVLYLAAGRTTPRRLGAGSVQTCSQRRYCGFAMRHDGIDQLDVGPSRAAYVWRMTGGSVYGTGIVWELRAAPLAGGRSTLLDSGVISGACGFRLPSSPSASSSPIAYLDAGADCDVTETGFATVDPVTGARATAPTTGGLAAGATRDGDTIYWLRTAGAAGSLQNAAPVPGAGACTFAGAQCELVASTAPAYAAAPPRRQASPADVDLARSDMGYSWVRGPAGTELLRPPARVPCAPSLQAAYVYTSARWSSGRHAVRLLRTDARGRVISVGSAQTRTLPPNVLAHQTRLLRCGDSTRLTYVVTTGRTTQRVSFAVARAAAPAASRG